MKTFEKFTHKDALNFGLAVNKIVERESLKPVRVRVVIDDDIVYQYMMDGKKGDVWLNRKQRTVEESGQSSLYVFEHQKDYKEWLEDDRYAICGGGYPIYIKDRLRGVLIVSGLRHDEDHDLIIKGLEEMEE